MDLPRTCFGFPLFFERKDPKPPDSCKQRKRAFGRWVRRRSRQWVLDHPYALTNAHGLSVCECPQSRLCRKNFS